MVGLECDAPVDWAAAGSIDMESEIWIGKGETAVLQGGEFGLLCCYVSVQQR